MKPRDRVSTALSREQPDRCPMQISFTPEFAARLRADMGLTGRAGHNPHGGGNTYELERALSDVEEKKVPFEGGRESSPEAVITNLKGVRL